MIENIINKKFNKWTIIAHDVKDKWGSRQVKCLCDCGTVSVRRLNDVIYNKSLQCRKCGYKYQRLSIPKLKSPLSGKGNNYRHGKSGSLTYQIWCGMISRCNDSTSKNYKWYKSRNIRVCDEWLSFENFYKDMGDKPDKLYIDRINNDLGYFKENCRWVDSKVNSQNRRNVKNKRI